MEQIRILLAEDDRLSGEITRSSVERCGHNVVETVCSAKQAMIQSALLSPDLVLMDVCLEGDIDGTEAAKEIRAAFNIPVIYLTANADLYAIRGMRLCEPIHYLTKPLNEQLLKLSIELALLEKQARMNNVRKRDR